VFLDDEGPWGAIGEMKMDVFEVGGADIDCPLPDGLNSSSNVFCEELMFGQCIPQCSEDVIDVFCLQEFSGCEEQNEPVSWTVTISPESHHVFRIVVSSLKFE
jgi:hypothetical protein